MDFPIPPEFWWSTDNLSASIFLQGVDQKILPCGQGRIDSVKINPSLLMMTDCFFLVCFVPVVGVGGGIGVAVVGTGETGEVEGDGKICSCTAFKIAIHHI